MREKNIARKKAAGLAGLLIWSAEVRDDTRRSSELSFLTWKSGLNLKTREEGRRRREKLASYNQ